MRILLIANTLPPQDVSGVGEQVVQLASGLRRLGHQVEILGRGRGGARGPKLVFPLTVVAPFLRHLRSFRPHVVQVHESDGALAALLTRVMAASCEPRPVLAALLQVSYRQEWRAVRPLRWESRVLGRPGGAEIRFRWLKAPLQIALGTLTAWLADVVLAPSRATADEIGRDYGVAPVEVVPNVTGGVDRRNSVPEATEQSVLFVGRLRIRKGVEVLLEALALLEAEGLSVRLTVVGDGEQRAALEERVGQLELEQSVEFLGRRSPSEVRALLATASAIVVPSIYEGMPLVVLEAMDQAVPVVASAVSGIPEVVIDGESGWLVPPEDPPRLAAALRQVVRDPIEAQRRGRAAKRRVESHFRPENAARTWERHVRSVMAERIAEDGRPREE